MPVIAISGKPGAGTSTIARKLAERLKLNYFSPGEFNKSHAKLANKETDKALEVWKTKKGKSKEFHKLTDDIQMEKAKKGNIVICGKLSIWMLKDVTNYKIWIDCSLEERAKRASGRDRAGIKETKKKLKEKLETERKEWKRIYGFDYLDQREMADIVIDSTNLNEEETLERIIKEMKV